MGVKVQRKEVALHSLTWLHAKGREISCDSCVRQARSRIRLVSLCKHMHARPRTHPRPINNNPETTTFAGGPIANIRPTYEIPISRELMSLLENFTKLVREAHLVIVKK